MVGTIVGDALWPWTRTTFDRFLVDRLVFIVTSGITVALLLRAWYRRPCRSDLVAAVIASGLALWLSLIPLTILRAIVEPVAPDLWTTLFGDPDSTLAYIVISGPSVAVALVFAVPICRTWLSDVLREPRRWAVRVPRPSD